MTYRRPCRRCSGAITETKTTAMSVLGTPVYRCRVECPCASGDGESDRKASATNAARSRYWEAVKRMEVTK